MRTIASLCPFPMSAGNFVGNTIEKVAVLPISIPPRKKYLVYSLFTWGEGAPVRTLGRMRGRSIGPTGQKKNSVEATGRTPFLQGKVGYRVAPSSDPASPAHLPPEGKALGEMSPIWKPSFINMLSNIFSPENASQIDLSIPEEIVPRPFQRQRSPNPASGNERL